MRNKVPRQLPFLGKLVNIPKTTHLPQRLGCVSTSFPTSPIFSPKRKNFEKKKNPQVNTKPQIKIKEKNPLQILPIRPIPPRRSVQVPALEPPLLGRLRPVPDPVLARQQRAQEQDEGDFEDVRCDHG